MKLLYNKQEKKPDFANIFPKTFMSIFHKINVVSFPNSDEGKIMNKCKVQGEANKDWNASNTIPLK